MKATSLNSSTRQKRPALRLVSTKELPREDWLQIRKQGIGSSDAAAAVGLNPYKSQLELWLEKTGRDASMPKVDPHDEESPLYWGNVLEPIVAWHYSKRSQHKVRRINAVLQHPDPALPWMLANIDREVIGTDDVQILECKTAGINGARLWKEGVPEYVQLQVMHQLAVTGKQAADVALQQRLAALGRAINLAYNLHPTQLGCADLTTQISALLKRSQIPATSVMFEVTESGVISAPASSLENLVRLRMLGCGLAMDDFGAGYSSLARLSELPFSQIKLDRVFVRKMQYQPKSAAIINCSVALAQALGVSLVVEGVETPEQQARLIDLGVNLAQGFLFARPMPETHFIDFCVAQEGLDR